MSCHIVDTDNFCGDYPDEKFLSWMNCDGNVTPVCFLDENQAKEICTLLNGPNLMNTRYYKVVQNGYKLVPGFIS